MAGVAGKRLTIELCLDSRNEAEALYTSLKAEEMQPSPDRGRVKVTLDGFCVRLEIEPRDLNSLRALMNSFLYLSHAAYSALKESSGK